jgi:hypothetical protein
VLYFVPTLVLAAVSLVVLFTARKDFRTPQDHFLGHPGELAILASNLSAAFTVTTFWVLFIFSIKSWSVPSFLALQGGILAAYLLYGLLLWQENKSKTFLNLLFGDDPPIVVRRIFFGLALLSIVVELGLGRAFVEAILVKNNQAAWIATASIAILGVLTILYTYSGGMFAVIMTDAIFVFLCVVIVLIMALTLDTVPQMVGLRADLAGYDFSRLSGLDYVFYFSAGSYVFLMFLFHPDFWYRNLRLPYVSKGRRLTTILFSAVLTSALLQLAYFIGASSRTDADRALIYNNLVEKRYDLGSVIDVLAPVFRHDTGTTALIFFVLVSAFTTVSSLIISAVAGYYETDAVSGSERYESLLAQFFKMTIVVTAVALTFDVVTGIFAALLIASSQLTLTSSIVCARLLRLPVRLSLRTILLSLALFIVSAFLNWIAAWHFYYPFLALASSAIASAMLWVLGRRQKEATDHGQ